MHLFVADSAASPRSPASGRARRVSSERPAPNPPGASAPSAADRVRRTAPGVIAAEESVRRRTRTHTRSSPHRTGARWNLQVGQAGHTAQLRPYTRAGQFGDVLLAVTRVLSAVRSDDLTWRVSVEDVRSDHTTERRERVGWLPAIMRAPIAAILTAARTTCRSRPGVVLFEPTLKFDTGTRCPGPQGGVARTKQPPAISVQSVRYHLQTRRTQHARSRQ